MHYRRILCLLLGLWLGGGLIMAWYGARSFATADQVVNGANPGFALQTRPIGPATTRLVLRHQIAVQNQSLFQNWEYMQLILGLLLFSYMLFGTLEGKFTLGMALLMVIVTAIQRFGISPELGTMGNTLDYLPRDIVASERAKFWLLHGAYLACEAFKFAIGLVILAGALRRSRSVDAVNKFDLVDKANHRHINW